MTEAFSAMLGHYLPYGHAPFLGASPFFPPIPALGPALETLAGSRALSALAQAQKRLRESDEDTTVGNNAIMPATKKSRTINEDPLDLSSGAGSIILGAGSSTNEMGTQNSYFRYPQQLFWV